ncbi:hypothetical protein A5N15_08885 [Rothia kristinae]|uniref:Uncharacterized protein n=1 Tax=Rothia kristinae TaxID=37923 RepID=A0A657IU08_9MICC|nr:hypothetical protein A5N15_08885 [Rothia kristinae]
MESRRAALKKLTRKYGADITEVLDWAAASRNRLQALEDDPSRAEALEEQLRGLRGRLQEEADRLRALREESGRRLSAAVSEELSALAMPNARLVVRWRRPRSSGPRARTR